MGFSNNGDVGKATAIFNYINAHPAIAPGWSFYTATRPDLLNNPAGMLDGYGGYWDRERNRGPGAGYAGSVQKFYEDVYALALSAGAGVPGGGGGGGEPIIGPFPVPSPPAPGTGLLDNPLTWAKKHPLEAIGITIALLLLLRRT